MKKVMKLTAEVLPHLQARKVLKILRCTRVVFPKVRTKDKTGNMLPSKCHENVAYLVSHYGGRHVLGYEISVCDETTTQVISHSVWETPEGDIVDVTRQADGSLRPSGCFAVSGFFTANQKLLFPSIGDLLVEDHRLTFYFDEGDFTLPIDLGKKVVQKTFRRESCFVPIQTSFEQQLEQCWDELKQVA